MGIVSGKSGREAVEPLLVYLFQHDEIRLVCSDGVEDFHGAAVVAVDIHEHGTRRPAFFYYYLERLAHVVQHGTGRVERKDDRKVHHRQGEERQPPRAFAPEEKPCADSQESPEILDAEMREEVEEPAPRAEETQHAPDCGDEDRRRKESAQAEFSDGIGRAGFHWRRSSRNCLSRSAYCGSSSAALAKSRPAAS